MPLSIISNYAAGVVHRHVERNDMLAGRMVARIASGSRVVYARDDATSLMVGTRLRADVGSMQMAAVNASHAAAVLQVADGAAEVVADMTIRLKTLAVQSASDQLTSNERQMIDGEYQQLLREMDRISHAASFNGKRVLSFTGDKIVPAGLRDGGDHAFSGQNGIVSIDTSGAMAGSMFAGSFDHAKNALTLVNLSTGEKETRTLSFRTLDDQERETVRFLSLGVTMEIDQKFKKQSMGASSNGHYTAGVSWLGLNADVDAGSENGPALTQLLPTSDPGLNNESWLDRLRISDLKMRALPQFSKIDVPFQEIRLSTSADVPLMASLIDYRTNQVEIREIPVTSSIGYNGTYIINDRGTSYSVTVAGTEIEDVAAAFNALASPPPFVVEPVDNRDGTTRGLSLAWKEPGAISGTVSMTFQHTTWGSQNPYTSSVIQSGAANATSTTGMTYEFDIASGSTSNIRSENGTKGRDTSLSGGTGEPKLFTRVEIRTAEGPYRPMTAANAHLSLADGDLVKVTIHNGETGAAAAEYMELSFRLDNVDRLSTLSTDLAATNATEPVAAIMLNSHRMFAVSGQESDGSPFNFQVGTTTLSSDTLSFRLPALTARSLGVADTNIRTGGAARMAITAADGAINQAARVRGEIGAIQNRFEFTEANLRTMAENTEQGRSELMDLDVASEMTKLTSQQILVQAGVSMLAQANQMPQQLMRLFQ
jgi:flagellin-like hook-associated protein FlgL